MIRFLACFAALAVATAASTNEPTFAAPITAGKLAAPPRLETSGLAASRRSADVLWTHDDSDGAAALYAVKTTGERVGVLHITGTQNIDWEDVASYELDGKPWLLIADIGDNQARRSTVLLHLVEEPPLEHFAGGGELSVRPARTLEVRYEDGPRDCESAAVDPVERAIYLLSKRDRVKRLYRVELEPRGRNAITIARHVGDVPTLPQPAVAQPLFKSLFGRYRTEPTAMDFAPDGSAAIVLTYGDLLWFERRHGEPWADALARPPRALPDHGLLQAEAACFSVDGQHLYVAGEGSRTLLRYDRTAP